MHIFRCKHDLCLRTHYLYITYFSKHNKNNVYVLKRAFVINLIMQEKGSLEKGISHNLCNREGLSWKVIILQLLTGFCRSIAGIVTAAHRGKLKTMFCYREKLSHKTYAALSRLSPYDVCRSWCLSPYYVSIIWHMLPYEVCRIWGFLVCRLWRLSHMRFFGVSFMRFVAVPELSMHNLCTEKDHLKRAFSTTVVPLLYSTTFLHLHFMSE